MKLVRFYLILLFVAVAGVGMYLVTKQNNDYYDETRRYTGQDLTATPTPTAAPSPTASPASTTLNTTAEADSLTALLDSIPTSDFDESTLDDDKIGL